MALANCVAPLNLVNRAPMLAIESTRLSGAMLGLNVGRWTKLIAFTHVSTASNPNESFR